MSITPHETSHRDKMKLIAFDLDDTLFSEQEFVQSSWRYIAKSLNEKYGLPYSVMIEKMSNACNAFDALDTYLKDNLNLSEREGIEWMIATYRNHKPDISLSDEVENLLKKIVDAGHAIAIVTDGRSTTQRNKINSLGLDRYVAADKILISQEIGGDKLSGIPFRMLDRLEPTFKCYVGDNPAKDFYWPNKLGWSTIMLLDSGKNIHPQVLSDNKPDYNPQKIIHRLSQLTDILK